MEKRKRVMDPMMVNRRQKKQRVKIPRKISRAEVAAAKAAEKAKAAAERERMYDDFWRENDNVGQIEDLWQGNEIEKNHLDDVAALDAEWQEKDSLEDSLRTVLDEDWGNDGEVEDDLGEAATESETKKEQKRDKVKEKDKSGKSGKKKWSKKRKIIVSIIVAVLFLMAGVGAYVFLVLDKATSMFEGNIFDLVQNAKLKQDKNGRSNFLIFGNSEDEVGHGGAMLTDSLMVVSVDQEKKDVKMFSLPRDLWVKYNEPCSVGYQGKINAVYMCGLENSNNDKKVAAEKLRATVNKITGVDVQYSVMADWTAVREVTNVLEGIDVDIYADDPRGLYDYATELKLSQGKHHLNGEQALALARARNSHGGYGLSKSNFDREKNQQRIVMAMREKALNVGVLSNPDKVFRIMDSLNENIKTNVSKSEVRTILDIAKNMKGKMKSIDTASLYKTGNIRGASVVLPAEATNYNPFEYDELQSYLKKKLSQAKVKKAKKKSKTKQID